MNDESKKIDAKPMNSSFVASYNDKVKINKLFKSVLVEGDTIAFKELKYIFMISEHSADFLYFSTIMAEKYNYEPAFETNYQILNASKEKAMQNLAIYNLIKSYELGNRGNVQKLNKLFPNGIPNSKDCFESNR
ncbi:hypothetical protein DEU42_11425 [Flavobacterium sp. AG291]|nr:hypothetical protein DEU42_11425 [Flavobacterium sp. AG291]